MVACDRQLLGLALAIIGFLGTVIICALPAWQFITGFNDTTVFFSFLEGLWKKCAFAGNLVWSVCIDYEDTPLPKNMKAARPLIIIAIIIELFGILLGAAASKFINFVPDERQRSKMVMTAGITFLIAGFFVLIPVSLTGNTITYHFNPPQSPNDPNNRMLTKMEWGATPSAVNYIGWFTAVVLFLGGGLVCSSFFCREETD